MEYETEAISEKPCAPTPVRWLILRKLEQPPVGPPHHSVPRSRAGGRAVCRSRNLALWRRSHPADDDRLGEHRAASGLDQSTLSREPRTLEGDGPIEIALVNRDLRRRAVWLTETCARRLEAAIPLLRKANTKLATLLSPDLPLRLAGRAGPGASARPNNVSTGGAVLQRLRPDQRQRRRYLVPSKILRPLPRMMPRTIVLNPALIDSGRASSQGRRPGRCCDGT